MTLGAAIKKQRKFLGYTLEKLAEISGLSKSYLCTLESGKNTNPSIDVVKKLQEVLGFEYAVNFVHEDISMPMIFKTKFKRLSCGDQKRIIDIINIFLGE